jgi:hypothetical protein
MRDLWAPRPGPPLALSSPADSTESPHAPADPLEQLRATLGDQYTVVQPEDLVNILYERGYTSAQVRVCGGGPRGAAG